MILMAEREEQGDSACDVTPTYSARFIDKNSSYKKCQYNKFEANARRCVCICCRAHSHLMSLYSAYTHTLFRSAAATCRVRRPAINFKYPFYGPITAPCFAIHPLNIGPGRVSSSYLSPTRYYYCYINETSFVMCPAAYINFAL